MGVCAKVVRCGETCFNTQTVFGCFIVMVLLHSWVLQHKSSASLLKNLFYEDVFELVKNWGVL